MASVDESEMTNADESAAKIEEERIGSLVKRRSVLATSTRPFSELRCIKLWRRLELSKSMPGLVVLC